MKHIRYTCDSCGKELEKETAPLFMAIHDTDDLGDILRLTNFQHCCDECRAMYFGEVNAAINKIKDEIDGQKGDIQ